MSRGQLYAAGVGAVAFGAVCLFAGMMFGQSLRSDAPVAVAQVGMVEAVPGRALLELLAQVERASMLHASEQLSYPDALRDADAAWSIPDDPELRGPLITVGALPDPHAPEPDPTPAGKRSLSLDRLPVADALRRRDELRAAGFAAWVRPAVAGADAKWELLVGGFPDADAADLVKDDLVTHLGKQADGSASPEVVELR